MPNFDVIADTRPQIDPPLVRHAGRPSISKLREILVGRDSGYFTDARLNAMTYNDLIYSVGEIAPPEFVATAVSPNPKKNVDYDEGFTFSATGTQPVVFSVVGGSLPTGMTLSTSGVLDGTPTVDGVVSDLVIRASNDFGSVDAEITLTVDA